MEKTYYNRRRHKHLTWNDRCVIERMLKRGAHISDIATAIDHCVATIYNEIKRGQYQHTQYDLTEKMMYAADKGQKVYEDRKRDKVKKLLIARPPKLLQDATLISVIEYIITHDKKSPQAALYLLEQDGMFDRVTIKSKNTIYSAIDKGLFPNLRYNDLPEGRHNKRKRKKIVRAMRAPAGTSIEFRADDVLHRTTAGHWEMDTVHGRQGNKKCLLVLTERKTRFEIVEKLKSCTADQVRKALNRIEKRYGSKFYSVFKTITVDNGVEFSAHADMEKALYRIGKRTTVFYCHPYAPHERGSNENNNKLIRRLAPKGANFDKIIDNTLVKKINEWINNYPRPMFSGRTSADLFCCEFGFVI